MKVLVVDAFDSSPGGRKQFKDFFEGVKYAFESETKHSETHSASGSTQYDVESLSQLHKYVYAYERNEFTDPSAIGLFDKIDCIFIDGDHRLLPWGQRTRPLLLLIKAAFFTNKAVFAAGAGLQFFCFVLSTGGKRIRLLNGEEGSDIELMSKFKGEQGAKRQVEKERSRDIDAQRRRYLLVYRAPPTNPSIVFCSSQFPTSSVLTTSTLTAPQETSSS